MYDQYALTMGQEETDYGRYRESVADYQNELDYLTGRYDTERDYDYGKYADARDFAYAAHRDDVADEQWQAEFDEAQRQFDEDMTYKKDALNASASELPSDGPYYAPEAIREANRRLESFVEAGDYEGLKAYLDDLVEWGVKTREEADEYYETHVPKGEDEVSSTPYKNIVAEIEDMISGNSVAGEKITAAEIAAQIRDYVKTEDLTPNQAQKLLSIYAKQGYVKKKNGEE